MIAELENIDNKYTYKIVRGKKVLLTSRYSYATKYDAIRGFQRFNSAVKNKENIKVCDEQGCYSVYIEVHNHVLANIVDFDSRLKATVFARRLNRERIFIKDKKKNKMYYFIDHIEGLNLIEPLRVEVIKENDEYISTIQNLNLYAYNENIDESIEELKNDLKDLYEDLFKSDYILANRAISLKKEFSKFLK